MSILSINNTMSTVTLNLKTILRFILSTLIILSLFRLGFLVYFFDRVNGLSDILYVLIQGLRVDLVVAGYFFLIPALISIWLKQGALSKFLHITVAIWVVFSFTIIIFMEVATPEFIHEYDVRPNRIFLDYLIYPKEVFAMLWEGYKPAIFMGVSSLIIAVVVGFRLVKSGHNSKTTLSNKPLSLSKKIGVSVCILLLGFMAIRSSVQHRPFNPSMVYFSNDNLVNSLVLNSTFSVLFAMYNTRSEQSAFELYGKMDEQEIIAGVQQTASLDLTENNVFEMTNPSIPTQRNHKASYQGKPKNIVILLQESLGARHVGGLGGSDLTPNIDKLLDESWNFKQAYATGTRSVRGIEAVFTGFSPGPSRSVVKLSKSQTGFFSIASLLKRHGYQTQFIYGGESHFDNMKSFFLGNGIDDIHDLPTFTDPQFIGSWGASDEDLYNEAHHEFERMQAQNQPFFSLVFTSSNHTPFEFPDGCLMDIETERQTMANAIRYSDCALGKFISKAKASSYWDNTIFLVIADHDSRTIGSDLVPMQHFRIPALIFGAGIASREDDRLVSQIDFAPTLLSLSGNSGVNPMIGFDLTLDVPLEKQRAMLQYNENFAWLSPQDIIIFQPNLAAKVFTHDGQHILAEVNTDNSQDKIKTALANSLWSSLAYMKGYYRDEIN